MLLGPTPKASGGTLCRWMRLGPEATNGMLKVKCTSETGLAAGEHKRKKVWTAMTVLRHVWAPAAVAMKGSVRMTTAKIKINPALDFSFFIPLTFHPSMHFSPYLNVLHSDASHGLTSPVLVSCTITPSEYTSNTQKRVLFRSSHSKPSEHWKEAFVKFAWIFLCFPSVLVRSLIWWCFESLESSV